MKFSVVIDKEREEEILMYLHERTALVDEIEEMIKKNPTELMGYKDNEIVKLSPSEILCFTVDDNKVFAVTENGRFWVKQRLYVIEDMLDKGFVKINQSCIANIKQIRKFDTSISGTLTVLFKNGDKDYVSRRQMKAVKERLGFNL